MIDLVDVHGIRKALNEFEETLAWLELRAAPHVVPITRLLLVRAMDYVQLVLKDALDKLLQLVPIFEQCFQILLILDHEPVEVLQADLP